MNNVIYTNKFARIRAAADPQETSPLLLLREIFKGVGELGVMVATFTALYIVFVFIVSMQ